MEPTLGRAGTIEGGQDRPQAARRGSLDGPELPMSTMDEEARQGFLGACRLRSCRRPYFQGQHTNDYFATLLLCTEASTKWNL